MFPGVGYPEMMVFGIIALLLFGKNLPDVARSLGKGLVEFKKGMRGLEDELRSVVRETNTSSTSSSRSTAKTASRPEPVDDQQQWTAPRFDPPTTEPQA